MINVKFNLQRFAQNDSITLSGNNTQYFELDGAGTFADDQPTATAPASGKSYVAFTVDSNTGVFTYDANSGTTTAGDISVNVGTFTGTVDLTLSNGITSVTLTAASKSKVTGLADEDSKVILPASATNVTVNGIKLANTSDSAEVDVEYDDTNSCLKMTDDLQATLAEDDSVLASTGEVITATKGACTVTGDMVSGLAKGRAVTIGDWTYTVDNGLIVATNGDGKVNKYVFSGSLSEITITAKTDAATLDTVSDAEGVIDPATAGPVVVSINTKDGFEAGKTNYYDADGIRTGTTKQDDSAASVSGSNGTYTVTILGTMTQPIQLDKTAVVTVTNSSKATSGNFQMASVDANGAATPDGAEFTVTQSGSFKTTAEGAVSVTKGNVVISDGGTLNVALKSSTVTLDTTTNTGETITTGGKFTSLKAGDSVTASSDAVASSAVSLNGTGYTLITDGSGGADSALTIMDNAADEGKLNAVLTSGYAQVDSTNKKLYYDVNSNADDWDEKAALATYEGSGDGVVVGSDGALSDLEAGDSVTLTAVGGATYKTWTVSGKILEMWNGTAAETDYYAMDESAASVNAAGTEVTGATIGVEIGTEEFKFKTGTGTTAAVAHTVVDGVYVLKNGSTSLSSTGAVGQFAVDEDTIAYSATSSAGGQQIEVADITGDYSSLKWSVTGGSGNDTITSNATQDVTVNGGAGKDEITVSGDGSDSILGGEGNDVINVTGAGDDSIDAGAGNDEVYGAGTGEKILYGGAGNDILVHGTAVGTRNAGSVVSLIGGEGADSIYAGSADDYVAGGAGKDVFDGVGSSITISDYTFADDVILSKTSDGDALTITATDFNSDGTFTSETGDNTVDVSAGTGTGGYYAVTLADSAGKNKQIVGWATENGGTINASSLSEKVVLIGSDNDTTADLLQGGSGKDTIYAGSNDSVVAGAGADYINVSHDAGDGTVYVGISTSSGKDTVGGFNATFDEGDQVYMMNGSISDVKVTLTDNDITFKLGNSSALLENVAVDNNTAGFVVNNYKVAVAEGNATIAASSADYADYYFGSKSALSFSGTDDSVSVNLNETSKYQGITTLEGGTGSSTLMGSTGKDVILSAGGDTSLWGAAGNDTLQGYAGTTDMFFFMTGDGKDTITNFEAYTEDTSDTADILNTNGAGITSAQLTSNGLVIGLNDSDKATITSITEANSILQFTMNGTAKNYAKVGYSGSGNTFSYDEKVNFYVGGSQHDVLTISDDVNHNVWLNGSQGVAYGSIDEIDASSATGNLILAGTTASETITGGSGSSSLWGGAGSASDTLTGSSNGTTMFWWGYGEGNDVANVNGADDTVNLYNVKLSDIDLANTAITSAGVTLALNDGSKLTVNASRDVNFTVDGTSWTAQYSSKEWKRNS